MGEKEAAIAVEHVAQNGSHLAEITMHIPFGQFHSFGYGVGVQAFISLRDNLDLSTPSGRLMFQIIGAMAEFERALIQERVRAGLRNAKAKGKRIGRPRQEVDSSKVLKLRADGLSWRTISEQLKVGLGTVYRAINSSLLWDVNAPRAHPVPIV